MPHQRNVCATLAPFITAGKRKRSTLVVSNKTNDMNANDQLREHTSTGQYHKYSFGLTITDGALALAEKFSCFWFLDIVASYQSHLSNEEFQVWTLRKVGSSAVITCTDGNELQLKFQKIHFTDFEPDEATVWVEFGICLLPSEH